MSAAWEVEVADETASQERVIDKEVQITLVFVQEHEQLLRSIEGAVSESIFPIPDTCADPVMTHGRAPERVFPTELVTTDNAMLRKVLVALVYLMEEVQELCVVAEDKHFPKLAIFGESGKLGEDPLTPGDRERRIGRVLPFLQEVSNFVERCNAVAVNLVQQLSSLYRPKDNRLYKTTFKAVQLLPVYRSLSDLLRVLITLDSIILQNPHLLPCWAQYKRMMEYVRAEPGRFGVEEEARVRAFEAVLVRVDQAVLSGAIFQNCIEQDFEDTGGEGAEVVRVRGNETGMDAMVDALKTLLDASIKALNSASEVSERREVVGLLGLYALYRRLCPPNVPPDGKLYRRLWSVQKDLPIVILHARTVWFAPEFLTKYAPYSKDPRKLDPQDVDGFRRQFTSRLDDEFPGRIQSLCQQVYSWVSTVEARLTPSARHERDQAQALNIRGSLAFQGLSLASRLSALVTSLLSLHVTLGLPLVKKLIRPLSLAFELLKLLEFTTLAKLGVLNESLPPIMHVNYKVLLVKIIRPLREKLEASRRVDDARQDQLTALRLIEATLLSTDSPTPTRQALLSLCFRIVMSSDGLKDSEVEQVQQLLKKLFALSDMPTLLRRATDCSLLFWHKELLPTFLSEIYQHPVEANRVHFVVAAFSDIYAHLRKANFETDSAARLVADYEQFMLQQVEGELLGPLCRDVENDLRLQIHTKTLEHVMAAINPKRLNKKALRPFLDLKPLRVLTRKVDVKAWVTHYLERVFYNLTTVALHDWMTYAEMRSLAADKFDLHIADNHLPMGGLDQGLDVLQIMRNIHVFVSRFTYNMNMQNFIERQPKSGAKHINTISIQSIAASLRQHGLGILNTTVNYTYQFLAQKFHVFSQFLFDEYIASHLSKERRWFKKNRASLNNVYPYERGVEMLRVIRKLGGPKDGGRSFMDQFRLLITEIGNALGYVRMVRSAGMYFTSEAVKYLPTVEDQGERFEQLARGHVPSTADGQPAADGPSLSDETVRAARNLDQVVSTLVKNFSEGNDFFRVLLRVFQEVLLSGPQEHKHLDNFFMIVPALCIAFCDDAIIGKDLMYKSNRKGVEAYYTDDGFAMGVAYTLAILDQGGKFDSLHWFEAVDTKLRDDERALAERQRAQDEKARREAAKSSGGGGLFGFGRSKSTVVEEVDTAEEDEEAQALLMTTKRLTSLRREHDMLFYSLNGARIFFKQA